MHPHGTLSDIDVQATLKSKLGVEGPKYRILGARNPKFAREALKIENKLGVLLPCNVIVGKQRRNRSRSTGSTLCSSMERTETAALRSTAEEVLRLLSNAVAAVGTKEPMRV